MFYALSWVVVFTILALWSLAAWAFHSITTWTFANAGVLAEGSGMTQGWRMPEWLARWVPPELALALDAMVSALGPTIEALVGWAPMLEGGLSVAVWVMWGIGSVLLIVLGFLATALIAFVRRRVAAPAATSGRPAPAG